MSQAISQIDLNRIRDFLRIVDLGNITRAAEAMGERKAKLSRNLALLERELGVQLIYRTTRQFQLTDMGQKFYREMTIHLRSVDEALAQVSTHQETMEGKIRLTAPEDLGNLVVTQLVSQFRKIHPRVEFELIYTNQILDLVKLGVDVAFRIGNLRDSSLLQKKLGVIDSIFVASPQYVERSAKITGPDDLKNHDVIGFSTQATDKFIWRAVSSKGKASVSVEPHIVANNYLTVRDLTLLGHGIAFLPRFLAHRHLTSGDLVQVLRNWHDEGVPMQLAFPGQKQRPSRVRHFGEFVNEGIQAILN